MKFYTSARTSDIPVGNFTGTLFLKENAICLQ